MAKTDVANEHSTLYAAIPVKKLNYNCEFKGERIFRVEYMEIITGSPQEITKKTLSILKAARTKYPFLVMVMAPIFNDENIGEGYIQRVKAIDDEILYNTFNVYIDLETTIKQATLSVVDSRHIALTFNTTDLSYIKAIIKIAKYCKCIYTHSVMRAMADIVGEDIHKLYKKKGIYKIWDVHGCVPEEFALAENYYEAQNAQEAEELFIDNSDVIITVNTAMKQHLEKKYSRQLKNIVTLPIFNDITQSSQDIFSYKNDYTSPFIVYAGGLQQWQNIPLMQWTIKQTAGSYRYKIFTSSVDGYKAIWGKDDLPQNTILKTISPAQVKEEYKECHFGFILRDDIAVNNVACPTKLIEYIQYGIVPIVKTENIGDFKLLGLRTIDYKAFITNPPSFNEYITIAKENQQLLQKLAAQHTKGRKELLDSLNEKFNI